MAPEDAEDPQGSNMIMEFLDHHDPLTELPQDILRALSKGILRPFLRGELPELGYLERVQPLWKSLVLTMTSASVFDSHLTAVCNAVSVFLENAYSSPVPEVKEIGLSKQIWIECFRAVMDCFEEGKIKPMRQVLVALIFVLARHPDRVVALSIQDEVLSEVLRVMFLGRPEQHLKPSLMVLDLVLQKVVPLPDLFTSIEHSLQDNNTEWTHRVALCGLEAVALDRFDTEPDVLDTEMRPRWAANNASFTLAMLLAMLSQESQSASKALFKTYSAALTGIGGGLYLYSTCLLSQPYWIVLVKSFLTAIPTALDPIADYLLPFVFKHDPYAYEQFVESFRGEDVLASTGSAYNNLSTLLAAVQVGHQTGLRSDEESTTTLTRLLGGGNLHVIQGQSLFSELLTHPDADVRIRTFSLVVAAPSVTTPLTGTRLQCLTQSLRYVCEESDPQNRSRIMSIIRRMLIRLRGGMSSIHKAMEDLKVYSHDLDAEIARLKENESFLAWFVNFVEDELGPSASYQRHIIGLKTLLYLMQSGLDSTISTRYALTLGPAKSVWPSHMSLHYPTLTAALFNLLLDPYEDVRATACQVIRVILECTSESWTAAHPLDMNSDEPQDPLPAKNNLQRQEDIRVIISRASLLARQSSRADHADGYGRLFELYYCMAPRNGDVTSAHISGIHSKYNIIDALLQKVEEPLLNAEEKLESSIPGMTLHGSLLALRYCVKNGDFFNVMFDNEYSSRDHRSTIYARMLEICQKVWDKVRGRLCIDSPENSDEENEEGMIGSSKDMLSYSWRALRDTSLLVQAILESPHFKAPERIPLPIRQAYETRHAYKLIGSLCFEQLKTLRHRGAFSTVAQTYSIYCSRLAGQEKSLSDLRNLWYKASSPNILLDLTKAHEMAQKAIEIVHEQASKTTRRSAGIPAMMAGLLTVSSKPFFNSFVQEFREIATVSDPTFSPRSAEEDQQLRLPQVHAINCVREVFTSSKFRLISEPYVMEMLDLAANSLGSNVWSIRNCGLMLFRACTNRLGRARTNPIPGPSNIQLWHNEPNISIERTPRALEVAIKLLNSHASSQKLLDKPIGLHTDPQVHLTEVQQRAADERVFAALDLIGRIPPSSENSTPAMTLVLHQMSSPVWMVREQAARVYGSQVQKHEVLAALARLAQDILDDLGANGVHGRLLCMSYILRRSWQTQSKRDLNHTLDQVASILKPLCPLMLKRQLAPIVRATLVEIMNDAFEAEITSGTRGTEPYKSQFWLEMSLDGWVELISTVDKGGLRGNFCHSMSLNTIFGFFTTRTCLRTRPVSSPSFSKMMGTLIVHDVGAAASILRQLSLQRLWNAEIRDFINYLLVFVICETAQRYPEEIQTQAMKGLAASIEWRLYDMPMESSEKLRVRLHELEPRSREGWNAKIRLQANFFPLFGGEVPVCTQNDCDLCVWIRMLREAALDETDSSTRLNAAHSLLAFSACMHAREFSSIISAYDRVGVYFILYDLLNDDDEEIRDVAALVASSILVSSRSRTPFARMMFSPPAARKDLALLMRENFCSERSFIMGALRRLVPPFFEEADGNCACSMLPGIRVHDLFSKATSYSHELFAEERQNLYVDEVREIETWSEALRTVDLSVIGEKLLVRICARTIEGLDLLVHSVSEPCWSGPLGETHRLEVFEFSMRFIKLAELLLHWARNPSWSRHINPNFILHLLETLFMDGSVAVIHGHWLRTVKEIIQLERGRAA